MPIVLGLVVVGCGLGLFALRSRDAAKRHPALAVPVRNGPDNDGLTSWLLGLGGEVRGKSFRIGNDKATIGRATSNLIQLKDKECSRKHCRLTPLGKTIFVEDLDSHNGLSINGRYTKSGQLKIGDELRVGGSRFRLTRRRPEGRDDAIFRHVAETQRSRQSTVSAESGHFLPRLEAVLRKHNGDFVRAAAEVEIDPQVLRYLAVRKGLGSGYSPR